MDFLICNAQLKKEHKKKRQFKQAYNDKDMMKKNDGDEKNSFLQENHGNNKKNKEQTDLTERN